MNLFFWRKKALALDPTLQQDWILEGFQDCVDGFWVWQNTHFYVSPRIKKKLGYGQLTDKNFNDVNWWKEFVHPEDIDKLKNFLKDLVKNDVKTRQIEIRIRHYHGHWVWFLLHCYVGASHHNQPQVLGTFSDVSAYRLLHDQLERIIEDLQTASQEKSHFISHLNHEIRSPLNGILGAAAQLQETDLTPTQQGYLSNVISSADLLLNMVNEILDLSKIAAGKLEIDAREFELIPVIQQVVGMFMPVAQQKKIHLILELDKTLPRVIKSDSLRLQQILINLLTNAIKFTDTGKVTLEVTRRLNKGPDTSNHLLFRVIDTGHGIAKEVLPQLFQDFTQASKSVVRTQGGTGLGLSICRKLIGLMSGEIGAQSTLGKGSTFWFILPIEKMPSDFMAVNPKEREPLKPFNLLVVEDNLINQQVLRALLTSLEQEFILSSNGAEALQLVETNDFDLIFMDMNMPVLDGFSATKQIRKLDKGKEIPIVILTADTYSIDTQEFINNGVTDIIYKPITKEKLREVLTFYQEKEVATPLAVSFSDSLSQPQGEDLEHANLNYTNLTHIQELCRDIGCETTLRLLEIYVQDGARFISQFQSKNAEAFYDIAHTLAGISENLGMQGVGQLSRDLMLSIQHQEENPSLTISQLIMVFNETILEIDIIKKKLTSEV